VQSKVVKESETEKPITVKSVLLTISMVTVGCIAIIGVHPIGEGITFMYQMIIHIGKVIITWLISTL
jgi:hypothetical protein